MLVDATIAAFATLSGSRAARRLKGINFEP
jgi:hypothetical protein